LGARRLKHFAVPLSAPLAFLVMSIYDLIMNAVLDLAMNSGSQVLWVNVSPSLKRFDCKLVRHLSRTHAVAYWQYIQENDEPSSISEAVALLHEYVQTAEQPLHLVGHGISGIIALLYARQHPENVRSLALLAVAPQPAINWHSHYYVQRQLMPCTQSQLLAQMAQSLFGRPLPYPPLPIVNALAKDLAFSPSPHSLYQITTLPEGGINAPLMVCTAEDDFVVTAPLARAWTSHFKPGDTLWQSPGGHHFFHYYHPELVSQQLRKFWRQVQQREQLVGMRVQQLVA
jgi:pimeloyl-ACP methyl ester carboxylesterase